MKKSSERKGQRPESKGESGDTRPCSSPSLPIIRWFLSKTVRQATAMRKHVHRILCAQRDILSPQAVGAVDAALAELRGTLYSKSSKDALLTQMENLEKIAGKWLKPYPNAAWRENVEVLLVALAVAMGIRTFFLQPFKIPTGSMQPTLFGVTSENLMDKPDFKIPTGLTRVRQWFEGISYVDVKAKTDGTLDAVSAPLRFLIFNFKQTIRIGGVTHTMWFPPDYGAPPGGTLQARAELSLRETYRKGDQVVRLKTQSGDHLFVDRLTYNFRKPRRGEIIVFETSGTRIAQQDTFYIKRLVGLGGETLALEKDYDVQTRPGYSTVPVGHLTVDGQPLSAATPHFENVYSFPDASRGLKTLPYQENHYYGHALLEELSLGSKFQVQPGHYFVLGDNTLNSADSRYWGDFAAEKVIGKSFFVYWPITSRFGWGHH